MNVANEAYDLSGLWTAKRKVKREGGKGGDESNDERWKEKQRGKVKWHIIHSPSLRVSKVCWSLNQVSLQGRNTGTWTNLQLIVGPQRQKTITQS